MGKECPKCLMVNTESVSECECGYYFGPAGAPASSARSTRSAGASSSPSEFQYLVVPFIGKIPSGGSFNDVSHQLNQLISEKAGMGWELSQVTETIVEISPGCLGALFGQGKSYERFNQVIFRRKTREGPPC